MNVLFSIYVLVLFFILTPGILLRIPKKGSKVIVALVHGLIFAAILSISGHYVWKFRNSLFEGAQGSSTGQSGSSSGKQPSPPVNYETQSNIDAAITKYNEMTSPFQKSKLGNKLKTDIQTSAIKNNLEASKLKDK
jgi:hypothetical protein